MKKRKALAFLLAAATVVTSMFSGALGSSMQVLANEKEYTITVFSMRIQPNQNTEVMKMLQEKTGVKFEVIAVPDDDYNTKLNLYIASNDMPDIYGSPANNQDAFKMGATLTTDLLAEYVPDIYESFQKRAADIGVDEQFLLDMWSVDGELKGFSNGQLGNSLPYGFIIRTDILEELGLDMPQTIADWDELLAAYKEVYPDNYPLTVSNGGESQAFYTFLAAYGVRRDSWVPNQETGKLEYSPFMDGMREAVVKLNSWFEKDYINPEYYTMYTNNQAPINEFTSGNTFMYQYYNISSMKTEPPFAEGSIPALTLVNFPDATFDWCPIPEVGDGRKAVVSNAFLFGGYIPTFGGHLEKEEDKFHKVLNTWNNLFSDVELYKLMRYGIEGIHYEIVDGAPNVKADFLTNDLKAAAGFGWPFNGQFDVTDNVSQYVVPDYVVANRKLLYGEDGIYSRERLHYLGDTYIYNSTDEIYSRNESYKTEWGTIFTGAIIGQISMDEYDRFIAGWKKDLGDDMTALINEENGR